MKIDIAEDITLKELEEFYQENKHIIKDIILDNKSRGKKKCKKN